MKVTIEFLVEIYFRNDLHFFEKYFTWGNIQPSRDFLDTLYIKTIIDARTFWIIVFSNSDVRLTIVVLKKQVLYLPGVSFYIYAESGVEYRFYNRIWCYINRVFGLNVYSIQNPGTKNSDERGYTLVGRSMHVKNRAAAQLVVDLWLSFFGYSTMEYTHIGLCTCINARQYNHVLHGSYIYYGTRHIDGGRLPN